MLLLLLLTVTVAVCSLSSTTISLSIQTACWRSSRESFYIFSFHFDSFHFYIDSHDFYSFFFFSFAFLLNEYSSRMSVTFVITEMEMCKWRKWNKKLFISAFFDLFLFCLSIQSKLSNVYQVFLCFCCTLISCRYAKARG